MSENRRGPHNKPNHPARRSFLKSGSLAIAAGATYALQTQSINGGVSLFNAAFAADAVKAGAPRFGGTLVVGQYQEPTVYDPNHQYSWETYRVDRNIYESLVAEDLSAPSNTGAPKLIPALAESWTVTDDAKTYTFKLRKGVKFHDGTDFDAHAVEFNVRRFHDPGFQFYDVKANAFMKPVYGGLKTFEVIDALTIRYTFDEPFVDFLRMLPQGNYVSGIFSPKALQTYGQDGLAEHPTGTGPFRFVSRVHGEKTELARHVGYWGARPYLDKIVFRPIADDSTRLSGLQAGEIDILTRVSPDAVQPLLSAGYTLPEGHGAALLYLGWNFRNAFAKKLPVRQAIVKAIDREGLAKTLFRGYATASYSIFNIGNLAYDPTQKDYAYDPAGARKLLGDAGFKDGDVHFTIATDVANQPSIEWIQRDLAKVGIKVNIVSQEWLTYTSNLAKIADDVAMTSMEWGFVTPLWLRIVYQGYVVARGGKDDVGSALAAAIAKAEHEPNQAAALPLWKAANQILQQQAAVVPLISFSRYFATGKQVQGFNLPAQNWYDLSKVWLTT